MSSAMISSGDRSEPPLRAPAALPAGSTAFFVDQDVRVFEFDRHLVRVGDEVGRQVAAVELHAFDGFELEFETLRLSTVITPSLRPFPWLRRSFRRLHGAIGGDHADLGDLFAARDVLRTALEVFNDLGHGEIDAALEVHRVHARGDRLHAFGHDRLCQHGGSGGAVTGGVVRLRCDFLDHLRAHVLELVLEFDPWRR